MADGKPPEKKLFLGRREKKRALPGEWTIKKNYE